MEGVTEVIDFRFYAKFHDESICEDTLSKIELNTGEDEKYTLLEIAETYRTSKLMRLIYNNDPIVEVFDTVTAPEGESFCFIHSAYGSHEEALMAFGR